MWGWGHRECRLSVNNVEMRRSKSVDRVRTGLLSLDRALLLKTGTRSQKRQNKEPAHHRVSAHHRVLVAGFGSANKQSGAAVAA